MTFSPQLETKIGDLLTRYPEGRQRGALIPILMYVQDEVGFLTRDHYDEVAKRVGVTALQVEEVVGYYSMLHKQPMGKYHVQVCTNISCLVAGGEDNWKAACSKVGVGHKERTADGLISLEEVECIGACSWAPAMQINYDFYHRVTPQQVEELIDGLRKVN
jgi:NADH-quinone oxidoreductase subunit E